MYYINSLHRVLWRICAKLNSSADEIEIRAKHRRLFLDHGQRSGCVVVEPRPISAAVKLREPDPGYSRARALIGDAGVGIAVVDHNNRQLRRDVPVEISDDAARDSAPWLATATCEVLTPCLLSERRLCCRTAMGL